MKFRVLKYLKFYGLILLLGIIFQSCEEVKDSTIKINSNWKFKRLETSNLSEKGYEDTDFDDSDWELVHLPHTAHIEPLVVNNQWQGVCWYRKSIDIPNFTEDKKVFIEFEAAMNHSIVWINGEEVSMHQGGYLPVVMDATKYLKRHAKNTIAVRLNNTDNPITGPKPLKRLDFNMYGGLYRNAWLSVKDKVYISHPVLADKVAGGGIFVSTPKVSKETSTVSVKTHIVNDTKVPKSVELVQSIYYDEQLVEENRSARIDIEAESDMDISEQFSLQNANLWSPKHPHLYHLKTKVLLKGKVIDEETTRFGIREFKFKNNQLYINGEKTFLRGVNRHQEYPFVGYALSDNAQYRDAKKIKDAGFDYIRLSHYPQSPAFMDACDELGLVVIDAILGWQFYNDTDAFRDYCYKSATNLIRRDRNHPCVMAWEVSLNETKMPIPFMEKLDKIVHSEYPGEQVYSCGWMDEVYDIYLQARQHRILHPHELKDKPLSVSEYGDWEYFSKNAGLNQDKLPNELRNELSSRQTRAYGEARMLRQAKNVQEAHNDNIANTIAYSDSYWVMYDYNRGYHDDIEHSGLMDIFRLPKFAYYFYQSQKDRDQGHILKIASYWNDTSSLNVKVYSNAEEVKLYLNDNLVSIQKPDNDEISKGLNHPPFTFKLPTFIKGSLKAESYVDGKKVAEDVVKTPQAVTKLKMWLDKSGKAPQSGVNDVLFLYIAGVDENGTINPDFFEDINVSINGDVKTLNVEKVKAEAGIATALIRIGNTKGKITISANAVDLTGSYTISVK
ncbi:glycoside hydrolase family 2 TIM barrel-domain containing protein [Flavivirga amylovorans]|uniref:Glycoside hydrolase family 2 TIM barrel-domain containing protein n=1 Tax=Flavivirga amylovorans TaxID=870486 RepID=A0ABT8WWT8_9FLAO|nr:glycoside hydrolase family 2 TIM barrel-domain containing protein [Flavivirga amylovorans]MDO5985854.1 glycoside hydrolase family 2 TIM barrel-domain containing protein [Flavivirga amylovorans]